MIRYRRMLLTLLFDQLILMIRCQLTTYSATSAITKLQMKFLRRPKLRYNVMSPIVRKGVPFARSDSACALLIKSFCVMVRHKFFGIYAYF